MGKVAVMGLLERHGEVRTVVVGNTKRKTLEGHVKDHCEKGSFVYTDGLKSYNNLAQEYIHGVIDHAEKYVEETFTLMESKAFGRFSSVV